MSEQPEDRYRHLPVPGAAGRSGLKLPAISLGLWQNFGGDTHLEGQRPSSAVRLTWASRTDLANKLRSAAGLGGERTSAASWQPTSPDIATSW